MEELDSILALGEGLMLNNTDSLYEIGRTNSMLKVKVFLGISVSKKCSVWKILK